MRCTGNARLVSWGLVLLLALSLVGIAGCGGDSADDAEADSATSEADSGDATMDEEAADTDAAASAGSDVSEDELADGAQDTAQVWFVGPMTEYTADDFDWAVESLVQANDGSWWARVSATPHDSSLETEQIYVSLSAGMTLWQPIDSGTGIDPPTDDRFPDEIRDEL